jgi:hypothetical protein
MAVGLKLVFNAGDEKKVSFTFPFANIGAETDDVKVLMQKMIENGEIYAEAPTGIVSADFVERAVTPIDVG